MKDYTPSVPATTTQHEEHLSNGQHIQFVVWDIAGFTSSTNTGLGEAYFIGAQAALLFLDGTASSQTRKECYERWRRLVYQVCGTIPIVVVTTKCDVVAKSPAKQDKTPSNIRGILMSTRTCYNFYRPFRDLARFLTQNRTVELVNDPVNPVSKEPKLSLNLMREYERRLAQEGSA